MDDKAVREEIISDLRDLGTDGWVCASAGADLIEAQAAELAELRRALGMVAHEGPLIEGVRALQAECNQHLQQALSNGQAAQTAERRCAELVAKAQAVVDRWDTPLWKDVPATAVFINELRTATTGDDRHAG